MDDVKNYEINDEAIHEAKTIPFERVFALCGVKFSPVAKGRLIDYLCPFHEHTSGSYHASKYYTDKNVCRCFACNEAWDTIAFVQKAQNLKFQEAVLFLLESENLHEKYLRKGKKKEPKKPYQLRYLTNDEKRVLGFYGGRQFVKTNINRRGYLITGIADSKPETPSIYDFDIEQYLKIEYISESDMWREEMQENPLGYRLMIIGKIHETYELLQLYKENGFEADEEDVKILEKVAKDFGYNRVMAKLK